MTSDVGAEPGAPSRRIHDRVRGQLHGGSAIYRLDEVALAAAEPDLILTQELCDVCAVSYREVSEAVRRIDAEISVVSLEPRSIEGILNTISTVGAMADAEDEAVGLVEILRERLGAIENRVLERRLGGAAPRRVVCLEWLDPPFAAGHWVPEQVRRAGGWELLGRDGERSVETTWDAVREVDPEQLLLIPCGLDAEATRSEWARPEAGLVDEPAPFAMGRSRLDHRPTSPPGPRVIEGVGLLAEVMDPDGFLDEAPPRGWIPLAV
jgi:iron complex transport system substrate-binding protein